MPPASTGGFSNTLAPGFRAVVGTEFKSSKKFYEEYYDKETTERNYEDYLAAAGLPIAPAKQEGGPITSIDPLEGTTLRVTPTVWAIGVEVTEEAWDDDLYKNAGSPLRAAFAGTADSLRERREIQAHLPFGTQGFTNGQEDVLPSSSLSLFNTAHTPVAGGEAANQANREDVDLSVTSFRDMQIRVMKFVNDRGLRISDYATVTKLIVPPDLKYTANEIMFSQNRPDTANRVENQNRGETSVSVTPYITDTDAWFGQAAKHFMKLLMRKEMQSDNFDDRRRRVAVLVAWERYKFQAIHWLGMHGSQGA